MNLVRAGWHWFVLGVVFFRELLLSVKEVALTVLRPTRVRHSAIVAIPLSVRSEAGIALLANMITLTPGTTSLHVSDDRSVLYVHVMNVSEDTGQEIKDGFEHLVMKVLP